MSGKMKFFLEAYLFKYKMGQLHLGATLCNVVLVQKQGCDLGTGP